MDGDTISESTSGVELNTTYQFTIVPIPLIPHIWDKVAPLIEDVIAKAPDDIDMDTCLDSLLSFGSILMTVTRGNKLIAVNTLRVQVLESGTRALYIPVVSGTEMDDWMDEFLEIAKKLALDHACTELRGLAARRGWLSKLKPYGWEEVFTTVRCKLGD